MMKSFQNSLIVVQSQVLLMGSLLDFLKLLLERNGNEVQVISITTYNHRVDVVVRMFADSKGVYLSPSEDFEKTQRFFIG